MNKKKNVIIVTSILVTILMLSVGTYAYWSWKSAENKNIVFNTSKDLQEYIVYDEGESKFVGDFKVSDTYLDGVHTTVSIYKKSEAKDIILYASIYMRVNEIGTNLANSEGLKWVVTKGSSTSNGEVLAEGNFIGHKNKDEFMLLDGIEVTETLEEYTIWLWLDSKYATEEMSGEKVDTSIWTQVDQYAEDNFEITSLVNDYQIIKATVVNTSNNIVSYAITNDNTEPTTWIDIPESGQRKIYNLTHSVLSTGTYYVWFKDSVGKIVNNKISINDIYTQGPICTWDNPSKDNLNSGETATIALTCVDTSTTIIKEEITLSDIILSGNIISLSEDIVKERVTNGYKYTFTITGKDNVGSTTLTLKANAITNAYNVGNNSVTSSNITVKDLYIVTFNGNMFSTVNSQTINGLTLTYDYQNSYLTINGTPTVNEYELNYLMGLTFNEGDKYALTISYLSGDVINNGSNLGLYGIDIVDKSKWGLSTRNTLDFNFQINNDASKIITISTLGASEGVGLKYWLWFDNPADWTFNNYKIKVNFTKVESKEVTYGSTYGSMPMPIRAGFTFDGWYTGENGTGTKITDDSVVSTTTNQTLYAKWVDNIKPYGTANLSLNNGNFTLSLSNYGDEGTGLTSTYGFALINSGSCENATYTDQAGVSKTYSESYTNGTTYYGCIKLTDNAGNISYAKSSEIAVTYSKGTQTYTTSGEHEFIVPATGTYKLEVWGAQGGNSTSNSAARGGYGAYSVGSIYLSKNDILYINVGGKGVNGNNSSATKTGGYNGGGDKITPDSSYYSSSGGGATHVATVSGELSTLSSYAGNNDSPILIVAGGGGGGAGISGNYGAGGNGGGIVGMRGTNAKGNVGWGAGGTQTTAGCKNTSTSSLCGVFGKGNATSKGHGGAGGGGYYGGGGTNSDNIGGGGGGSGNISNNNLYDKYMYCYNCTTSDEVSTKTYTTTNVSDTPTTDYAKSGDGAARITYNIVNNVSSIILTYNNNGGSGCYTKSIIMGDIYGSLCTPVREGYSFDGWYTAASDGTVVTSSTTVSNTGNHTIYAHWTKTTLPAIAFGMNGNSEYVSGNVSSTITVSKGDNNLNPDSFKYIYSKDSNAAPTNNFTNNSTYSLEGATGIYYLIAKACDVNGNCTTKVSDPFYVDNSAPTVLINSLTQSDNTVTINVTATDSESGIKNYGYLITKDNTCPTSGYMTSGNTSYTFNVLSSGTYYVCVKVTDNVENSKIVSDSIDIQVSITYNVLINNYSCANTSVGTSPVFTYTGNCEVVDDGDGNWKVKFLSDGNLKLAENMYIDVFLVGGGAGGGSGYNYSDGYGGIYYNHGGGGGGGYTKNVRNQNLNKGQAYSIVIGSGGAACTSAKCNCNAGSNTQAFGITVSGGLACSGPTSGSNGGSGGGAGGHVTNAGTWYAADTAGATDGLDAANVSGGGSGGKGQISTPGPNGETGSTREFGEDTGDLYATGGNGGAGIGIDGAANTGNGGGGNKGKGGNSGAGGSGIVVIRNARTVPVTYHNNGGSGCTGSVFSVSETYGKLCVPVREGYYFAGWYTTSSGGTRKKSTDMVDTTVFDLYARWSTQVNYSTISSNYSCANIYNGDKTSQYMNYTGNCEVVDDGDGNWKVRFLTDGNLTFSETLPIDVFLVGGGAGGGSGYTYGDDYGGIYYNRGGGGGGGYTKNVRNQILNKGQAYSIVIGAGGAACTSAKCNCKAGSNTQAFGITVSGGLACSGPTSGSNGGSGGGAGGHVTNAGTWYAADTAGATDGLDAANVSGGGSGGKGQISTPGPNGETGSTREFGEDTGDLYATGGNGGAGIGIDGAANTGNGGGGNKGKGGNSGVGGSGIVVIRNKR